jgi:ATP-dependent Zn protease
MGKKTKENVTETDTENDNTTEDTDTETDKSDRKEKSLLSKFNKLSKKTKLYLGIFIILLLAGIFMWYKNRKAMSGQSAQSIQIEPTQIQQIIPNNTISLPQVVQAPIVQTPVVQAPVSQISNPVSPQNVFS